MRSPMQNILHFIYNGEVNMARKEVDNFPKSATKQKLQYYMRRKGALSVKSVVMLPNIGVS